MDARALTADELEVEADRVRGQIGATVDRLRVKLTPRNFVEEIAERSGVRDLTPSSVLDFAIKRHPATTMLIGLGVGLFALSAVRSTGKTGPGVLHETIGALSQSAKKAFNHHVEAKRRDFIRVAEAHLSSGVENLSGAVEKKISEMVEPAPAEARPLIESALQILVVAGLETMIAKAWK